MFTKKQVIFSPGFPEWLWEGLVVSHLPHRRRLGLCRRLIFAAGRVHSEIKAVDGRCLAGNDHHVVSWRYRYVCCCCRCWCSLDTQSTYIRRVQSCVWRLPKYWPPTPLSNQRVCPPPAPKAEGTLHTRRAVRGVQAVKISEDASLSIGLVQ